MAENTVNPFEETLEPQESPVSASDNENAEDTTETPMTAEEIAEVNDYGPIEPSESYILDCEDLAAIEDKMAEIDRQLPLYGNYVARFYNPMGVVEAKMYSQKEAQDLHFKLQLKAEKLQQISWSERSYKEWSLRWMLAKFVRALRYVVDPVYRGMLRDAAAIERRADLNAQYKAYIDRAAKQMEPGNEPAKQQDTIQQEQKPQEVKTQETTTKEPKEKTAEEKAEIEEAMKRRATPLMTQEEISEKSKTLYDSLSKASDQAKPTILLEFVRKQPDNLKCLKEEDRKHNLALAGFQRAMKDIALCEGKTKDTDITIQRAAEVLSKCPQLAAGLSQKEQDLYLPCAAEKCPEVLQYVPEKVAEAIRATLPAKNEAELPAEKPEQLGAVEQEVKISAENPIPEPVGQNPFTEPLNLEMDTEPQPSAIFPNPEPAEQTSPDTNLSNPFAEDLAGSKLASPKLEENPFREDPVILNLEENPFPEKPVSWEFREEFIEAVINYKAQEIELNPGDPSIGYDLEVMKEAILSENPQMLQYLTNDEKTTTAIVAAVSRDISTIKYVPNREDLIDTTDRQGLKKQIMDQVCENVLDEARQTGHQPMEILRSKYCKASRNDTKEATEMKKELRGKGFELNQQYEQEKAAAAREVQQEHDWGEER